jgi:hypothetical protein
VGAMEAVRQTGVLPAQLHPCGDLVSKSNHQSSVATVF